MKNQKIYVAGHTGLVGSSVYEYLLKKGHDVIVRKKKRT